jgi:transcriptional regulator with XRE-family HTH domain
MGNMLMGGGGSAGNGGGSIGLKLNAPYANLVPPLTAEEYNALQADIATNGLLQEIVVDEVNAILDGHHRYKICRELGTPIRTRSLRSLATESEKKAYVIGAAFKRRNLGEGAAEILRQGQRDLCRTLRRENAKKWTLVTLAALVGVDRTTVGKWFNDGNDPNTKSDARRTLSVEQVQAALAELAQGASVGKVAKTSGVSKGRISQLKKAAKHTPTPMSQTEIEDLEMEELIAEGEEHLRRAVDCFFPFDDEVARVALRDAFGDWFGGEEVEV